MPAAQLERLISDSKELALYAQRVKRKGFIERMAKILEKKSFLDKRIAEVT